MIAKPKRCKHIAFYVVVLFAFLLGACAGSDGTSKASDQESRLQTQKQNEGNTCIIYTVDDIETGVQYIVVTAISYRGGVAITPRLNADGTPYTNRGVQYDEEY